MTNMAHDSVFGVHSRVNRLLIDIAGKDRMQDLLYFLASWKDDEIARIPNFGRASYKQAQEAGGRFVGFELTTKPGMAKFRVARLREMLSDSRVAEALAAPGEWQRLSGVPDLTPREWLNAVELFIWRDDLTSIKLKEANDKLAHANAVVSDVYEATRPCDNIFFLDFVQGMDWPLIACLRRACFHLCNGPDALLPQNIPTAFLSSVDEKTLLDKLSILFSEYHYKANHCGWANTINADYITYNKTQRHKAGGGSPRL